MSSRINGFGSVIHRLSNKRASTTSSQSKPSDSSSSLTHGLCASCHSRTAMPKLLPDQYTELWTITSPQSEDYDLTCRVDYPDPETRHILTRVKIANAALALQEEADKDIPRIRSNVTSAWNKQNSTKGGPQLSRRELIEEAISESTRGRMAKCNTKPAASSLGYSVGFPVISVVDDREIGVHVEEVEPDDLFA